ncbi:MAG: PAS domain S-box protein [Gammaproteobacteria bacterium]|nr:PAS domain S-box protein [Gammaproteobacteria bacterium]MBU0826370.1 PAS domain S-box protein [Gammaproteobacteria bacterium]MBU0890112.1 PAS domain S-box protein [Gammaproteobacteria bacterium]MBU1352957.1 PAS domain S-box protein [Gammaproteobacteria bacterium]MBU1505991.1 PAS domain S-box protein [Gammaproteobacteria bacterium]
MTASRFTVLLRWRRAWRRWSLWTALVLLVVSMLATMVWLAGRYEASQVQTRLERDTADAVSDIRVALNRNLQSLQALHAGDPGQLAWDIEASELLRKNRELVRIEWREPNMRLRTHAQSPYRPVAWDARLRESNQSDSAIACANARRLSSPSYSSSYFQPHGDGLGSEMMELCLPLTAGGRNTGFLVVTYSLQDVLINLVAHNLTRSQEASFTEPDGTRLAVLGAARRGSRMFTAQHLLDLPGSTLVLRMDTWHAAPSVFPNVLTALVTTMSIALVTVMAVLVRDNRRRLRAERDLADALAFRKAMEDSLVTGLRARDLEGRITYVNPAFCAMVGFGAQELLGQSVSAPYWPPELVDEYRQRQQIRLAGQHVPPREGFESVFMRKDGTRFPVLIIEAPLINAQGQHTGWMSAFLDISEQRRVEELSRASQERLQATARLATVGEMASLLSHELNQPLAAISSYATGSINLLQPSAPDAAPDAEQLQDVRMAMQQIARQAERAGKVIKSVHDFVRRRDQAREAVHAQQLLDAILPLVILQARKLGVRVHTTVEPGLPPTLCDRTMVEQVLLNLARNAMQAMDDPAIPTRVLDIRVRRTASSPHSGWVEFAVTDIGTGIAPEVAEKLFTPFFTTRPEGMGLGLSMCRTVIEQHGGFLGFAPHEPRGTVFTFTLPLIQPSSSSQA